ncbi:MAG: hypothetical protein Q8S57_00175 [Methanoregula sp.]|nr:hypothetical protein [Methanoregula sp.]
MNRWWDMGKKNNIDAEQLSRKGKRGKNPFSFLGTQFEAVDKNTVKHHVTMLIIATIIMKFVVVFFTTEVFGSFIDYFDIGVYLNSATPLLQGQVPYINYQFEYPILLFIPILLAFIPAVLTQNAMVFALSFQSLMIVCDILIVLSVYFIGLKIYSEKTAFYGGLIYATAFSTAYFVITKSDAFPTCILMVALLFTIYGMNTKGYISATMGFFTKIFPVVALPFMVLYNAKSTALKTELISAGKLFLLFCILLLLPFALINPKVISTYLFATGGSLGVYVNTATFTIYSYLHYVFHLGITPASVSTVMYVLMGITLILLLYFAYAESEKNPKNLIKLVLCAIFSLVFFTKFHSPQYLVWFTPLLALLVADDIVKIVLFYITQIFAYIEFPLMFGKYYVNLNYTNPVGTPDWYITLGFFTLEYIAFLILLYFIIRPKEGMIHWMKFVFQTLTIKKE